ELVPVAGPLAVLGGDLDVVVRVGEQLERLTREAVAQVAAPPVDAQRSAALPAAGGVGAAARQARERRDGTGGAEQGQGAAARDHRRSFGSVDRGPEGPAAVCGAGRGVEVARLLRPGGALGTGSSRDLPGSAPAESFQR